MEFIAIQQEKKEEVKVQFFLINSTIPVRDDHTANASYTETKFVLIVTE